MSTNIMIIHIRDVKDHELSHSIVHVKSRYVYWVYCIGDPRTLASVKTFWSRTFIFLDVLALKLYLFRFGSEFFF